MEGRIQREPRAVTGPLASNRSCPEFQRTSVLCQTPRMQTTSSEPPAASEAVRRRMQSVRRRDTVPELLLRKELHRRGLRYRVDTRPLPDLRRKADIVFRSAHVAVFVDGCFWHFCPIHRSVPKANHAWWRAKLERTRLRDAETDSRLVAAEWAVVRVWEHEDPESVADRVEALVEARRTHGT